MTHWIRFRQEEGNNALFPSNSIYLSFNGEKCKIDVYALVPLQDHAKQAPLFTFDCDSSEQVHAAEELIFDGLSQQRSVVIDITQLDQHAEYLSHLQEIRMLLAFIHQGVITLPRQETQLVDELALEHNMPVELQAFESILTTYLEVPSDVLRLALKKTEGAVGKKAPLFKIEAEHEIYDDHGVYEYWCIHTILDHNYTFRDCYQEMVRSVLELGGPQWVSALQKTLTTNPNAQRPTTA